MFIFKILRKEMYEIFYKYFSKIYLQQCFTFIKKIGGKSIFFFKFMNILVNAIHFIKNV
jgi:hypothetical protein